MSDFFTHPRDYLLLELEKRQSRNSSYSLRALARDLDLAPSTLSEVIRGRYGLSEKKARNVAKVLGLDPQQAEHFVQLFQRKFSKKKSQRRTSAREIQKRRNQSYNSLPVDSFKAVSDWYHMALLEWMNLHDRKISKRPQALKKVAEIFKIEILQLQEALQRLERLGQIKSAEGYWLLTEDHTTAGDEAPSEAIRQFHHQILQKAIHALTDQPPEQRRAHVAAHLQRPFSSTVFSFPQSRIDEATKVLKDFRREFAERFGTDKESDSVQCLSMQFFSLVDEGESRV